MFANVGVHRQFYKAFSQSPVSVSPNSPISFHCQPLPPSVRSPKGQRRWDLGELALLFLQEAITGEK